MRGWAFGALPPLVVLASACLGIVDVPPDPTPTEVSIVSWLAPDDDDPSLVEVEISVALDTGVGVDGAPRRVLDSFLRVEGARHAPSTDGDRSRLSWRALDTHPAPGPEAVLLGLPPVADLPPPRDVNMRVRVDVIAGDSIVLTEGEDLVVTAEPLTSPAESIGWSLNIASLAVPSFRLQIAGSGHWPSVIRVPAQQVPSDVAPFTAELRIHWDRSLTLVQLTPIERYDVRLESNMIARWKVVTAASP